MTTTGCPVDESFDPLSPGFLTDPYAVLAGRPGDGAPVFFAPSIGYYVVTRYEDVEEPPIAGTCVTWSRPRPERPATT